MPFNQASEDKESDSKAPMEPVKVEEPTKSEELGEEMQTSPAQKESTSAEAPSEESTENVSEKPVEGEGGVKEEESIEITEDKEAIPDDKKDLPVVEEKPTVLVELAVAPRDNIIS